MAFHIYGSYFYPYSDETIEALVDLDVNHTPQCDFTEYRGQCTQQWYFTLVLNVDEASVTNDRPIDATGKEFERN